MKTPSSLLLRSLSLLAVVFAIGTAAPAQTPAYRVVLLHDLVSPAPIRSQATGVSNGVAVGHVLTRSNYSAVNRAVAWNLADNSMLDLNAMGGGKESHAFTAGILGDHLVGGMIPSESGDAFGATLWDTKTRQTIRLPGPESGTAESLCGNLVVGSATFAYPQWNGRAFNGLQFFKTLFSGNPRWGADDRQNVPSAVVWNLSNNRLVSLHNWLQKGPYTASWATDISGNFVVGQAVKGPVTKPVRQSFIWNLTTRTATNLQEWTPTGFTDAMGRGIWGTRVVGTAADHSGKRMAFLWNLESRETVDLHAFLKEPTHYSEVRTIAANRVVGIAGTRGKPGMSAILWDLSTGTATNLHREYLAKAGFTDTIAVAVDSEGIIVGYGSRKGTEQAWALVPAVRQPREAKPLPTANVGETPLWASLLLGVGVVLPVGFVVRWVMVRRRKQGHPVTPPSG